MRLRKVGVYMSAKKGFTLIELIIVLTIIGILARVAVVNYTVLIRKGEARTAQNNLIAIFHSQNNFYFSNGLFCYQANPGSAICDPGGTLGCSRSLDTINCNLALTLVDPNFTYMCFRYLGGNFFTCTATNIADAAFTLTIVNSPTTIILPGGTGCVSDTTGNPAPCNPSCHYVAHPNYCPNN
jgi:prepilin-type N-terminal cleavage/methylation domain-containing protein